MSCNLKLVWITYHIVYLAEMFTCIDVSRGAVFLKPFTEHNFLAIVLLVNIVLFAIVLLVNIVLFAIVLFVNVVLFAIVLLVNVVLFAIVLLVNVVLFAMVLLVNVVFLRYCY